MTIKTLFAAVGLSLTLGIGANAPAHAQSRSLKEVQVADLRTMKDKFVGLAEAFPSDKYGWMPMEGVRSVKDVIILITTEGNRFPTQWGAPSPNGVNSDRGDEKTRLQALSRIALTEELGRATTSSESSKEWTTPLACVRSGSSGRKCASREP